MMDWSAAYELHGPVVRAFLIRRLANRDEAEDICQETFARAMKAEGSLRDRSRLRPYLLRIAHNLMINQVRRRGRVHTESELGTGADLAAVADERQPSPAAETMWAELKGRLGRLLEDLPPEQRTAFEEGVLLRRRYAEIATENGWSVSKVKINVYRARKVLMEGLRDYRSQNEDAQAPHGRDRS